MEYSLKNDEYIRLYLKVFIPIPEIRNKIIKIKNKEEENETLKYQIYSKSIYDFTYLKYINQI